jgi:hypothetical protein
VRQEVTWQETSRGAELEEEPKVGDVAEDVAEDVVGDVEEDVVEDVVGEVAKPRKVDGEEAGVKLELVVPDKVQEDRTNFNLNQMLKKIRPIIKNN